MSIFNTIKNVIVPALKEEIKKNCEDWIEYTLYHEPYDFSKVVPGAGNNTTIRVIGKIVTRY
jgi:hypothetical protein